MTIFLFSCSGPDIVVHSPINNDSIIVEGNIYIRASIYDDDGIKKVYYKIFNNEYTFELPSHPTNYELDEINSMYNAESTILTISAEDVSGASSSKMITIYKQQ